MVEAKAFDTKEWLAEVYAIVGDLQETLDAKNPQRGRQALKQLLTAPVTIKPGVGEDGEPTWSYSFTCAWTSTSTSMLDLCAERPTAEVPKNEAFSGIVSRRSLIWCPRGDSNTRHAV
jgi:hypothetical protein